VSRHLTSNYASQIRESHALFDELLQRTNRAYLKGDLASVIAWAKVAAHFAFIRHPGFHVSPELENLLLKVAQELEKPNTGGIGRKSDWSGRKRFLHVVTECYETGGHTAFLDRWIKTTSANSVHSLVSTANIQPLPQSLIKSVTASGGWYCSLPEVSQNLLEQALFLRKLAREWADVTVLFIQPFDPLPVVSLGVEDISPVVFCNHADHAFWLGASITDVIADYHYYGSLLCSERRGISDSKILPIPLLKHTSTNGRVEARGKLGLKSEDIMLLTVGRTEKFLPFGGYDFLGIMVEFLKSHPKVKLFAVGPEDKGNWNDSSKIVNGRIMPLGLIGRERLETFYEAADIYVPGFPCGSGTAMLEAGMHEIPIVGLHVNELPYLSIEDDVSFKQSNLYASFIPDFLEKLDLAIENLQENRQRAQTIKKNIEQDHCSPGWNFYLTKLLQSLPSQHKAHELKKISSSKQDSLDLYLSKLDSVMLNGELLEYSLSRLIRVYSKHLKKSDAIGVQVKIMIKSFEKADTFRHGKNLISNFIDTIKLVS
jgi:hypothetical protein